MFSGSRPPSIEWGTPPIASISVSGTTTMSGNPEHKAALADFKEWLKSRHPGVKITVRCRWRPEDYGHSKVVVAPVTPFVRGSNSNNVSEPELHLLWREQSLIEEMWRRNVGWGEY